MLSPGTGTGAVFGDAPVQRTSLGVVIWISWFEFSGLVLTVHVEVYRISISRLGGRSLCSSTNTLGQVGTGDSPLEARDLIHLVHTLCKCASHIRGMVEMASFFLVEFLQRGKGTGSGRAIDDGSERLDGCSKQLEESHLGIAEAY